MRMYRGAEDGAEGGAKAMGPGARLGRCFPEIAQDQRAGTRARVWTGGCVGAVLVVMVVEVEKAARVECRVQHRVGMFGGG